MNDRTHLTATEVDKLMAAAKGSRNRARDRCLLLLILRHGLQVSEACSLMLSQVDIESQVLHVARLKGDKTRTGILRTLSDKDLVEGCTGSAAALHAAIAIVE